MKPTPQSLAKQFCAGIYVNTVDASLWRETFSYLAQSSLASASIVQAGQAQALQTQAITQLWAEYGGDLRARIRDDDLILKVLKKYLRADTKQALRLYRGESWFLFDQDEIGFCWTRSEAIATQYAKGLNAVESGGVLLTCMAPPTAILGFTPASHRFGEVFICDPTQLHQLSTRALFAKQ